MTKYINRVYIAILALFFVLRINADLMGDVSFDIKRYCLLIILLLIFYFDNLITWIIGLAICAIGIYVLHVIDPYRAEPTLMNFSFYPIYWHLPISKVTMYLKHYFSYIFYISAMLYFIVKVLFELKQRFSKTNAMS